MFQRRKLFLSLSIFEFPIIPLQSGINVQRERSLLFYKFIIFLKVLWEREQKVKRIQVTKSKDAIRFYEESNKLKLK